MPKKARQTVDDFMAQLDHPLKAEIQTVRDIIKAVNPGITEEVKWNAPSFSYGDYLVTFHLRPTDYVHLVFHNPHIADIPSDLLEGDYADRRMAYFTSMDDIAAKRDELARIVAELIARMGA